jgi:transcriptional regulator with XRE-family HTH domain
MGKDFNRIREWLEPRLAKLQKSDPKMTRELFAIRCGITRAALYAYMQDVNRPAPEVMTRICEVLGVPAEEGLRQYTPKREGRPKNING